MNLDTFFEKFELFADAPNAVAKIRELVLQLGATGKLTKQNLESERVSSIYDVEAQSEELPRNWRLLRFGSFCDIQGGNQPPKSEFISEPRTGYVRLYQIRDLGEDPVPTYIPQETTNRFCHVGEILIGRYGASVGKVFWAKEGAYNVALAKFIYPKDTWIPDFAFLALRSSFFQSRIAEASRSAQAGFNKGDLASIVLPLPPLAEQKRIVAKVDELMALCDRLEAQQQQRETRHTALAQASLTRFADAPTPANLELLFHKSYAIEAGELRKLILCLAIDGNLCDGQQAQLVSMEELVGQRNLRNGLSLKPTATACDFSCLPLSAMRSGRIDCNVGKPVELTAERAEPYLIRHGDVFLVRGNGSKDLVGRVGLVTDNPKNVIFPDLFIRIPLPLERITPEYFLIAWNSPLTRSKLENLAKTTSGIWKVNQGHIAQCEIPLPPLPEQKRIVAKVEQLMGLVDRLEAQLAESRAKATALLEAVVAELSAAA